MRSARRAAGALLDTVGLAMLAGGPVLVARGLTGRCDLDHLAEYVEDLRDDHLDDLLPGLLDRAASARDHRG